MTQKTQTPSTTGTAAPSSGSTGQDTTKSSGLVTEAKHALVDVVGLAADQAGEQVAGTKERAAEGLGSVVKALRSSGEGLGEEGDMIRGYVDQVADRVDGLSNYVRSRDMGQIVSDVERMARREPALFIGGAFVLGLFTARFLKSTAESSGTQAQRSQPQQRAQGGQQSRGQSSSQQSGDAARRRRELPGGTRAS